MINTLLILFTYAFDLFLILTFFNNVLQHRKKQVSLFVFYGSYCVMETVLFASEMMSASLSGNERFMLATSVSLLTSYALTFLYQSPMRHRLFAVLIFQVLAVLGEMIFTMLMAMIRPSIFTASDASFAIMMNLGSKAALFFFILIVSFFWNRRLFVRNPNYHIFILTTPLVSLVTMLLVPIEDIMTGNNRTFFLCLYIALALLNILNHWLINKSFQQEKALYRLRQMEMQIAYQKERYVQLGAAYKTNRRLIHDTKKHYFILQEHLKRKEYRELRQYLQLAMKDIEDTYTEINTGNLVIDAFVSNFKNIAETNGISFSPALKIDANRIPINDYDLCVILGNLLDNSFNACRKNAAGNNHIALTMSVNENDMFYIHIENTYDPAKGYTSRQKMDFLKHGYGMDNIENIVEKNHGFLKHHFGSTFCMDIVIPIIDVKKRLHPPVRKEFT